MIYALIVAGGQGSRMNSTIPKQFLRLHNKPILFYTIQQFISYHQEMEIVVVLPKDNMQEQKAIQAYFDKHIVFVEGGNSRFESVKNGLYAIKNEDAIVFIHDGVRPFISKKVLDACYTTCKEKGNAIPCIEVTDSLRHVENGVNKAVQRVHYKAVQTPQTFNIKDIKEAYTSATCNNYTDDASVLESLGKEIFLCEGDSNNIKITTPKDISIAEIMLQEITTTG